MSHVHSLNHNYTPPSLTALTPGSGPDPVPAADKLHRCSLGLTTRGESLNEETRTARFVASTADIDSYGEVVEQYWDLSRFKANPIILFSHNRGGAGFWGDGLNSQVESLPVGKGVVVEVVGDQLEIEVKFADEKASPMAPYVWEALKQGTLRTMSVGFMPGERTREERENGDVIYHIGSATKPNELFESSIVIVPANPRAVMKDANQPGNPAGQEPPQAAANGDRNMDKLAEVTAKLEAKEAELATVTGQLATAEGELATEREEHAKTKVALDTAQAATKTAEAEAIKVEVNAMVGKKILPAEVEDQVELRALWGKDRWEKSMSARADVAILGTVVKEDPKAKNTAASGRRQAKALLSGAIKAAEGN